MKILMINHFPLEGSGSGTYTKNLAVSLTKMGHSVSIIMPENAEDYPEIEGVRLHPVFFTDDGIAQGKEAVPPADGALPFNFPCFTSHPRSVTTFSDLTSERMDAYTAAFKKAIEEEMQRSRPDVIHGQHVWILSSLAAERGVPLVLTAHGTDLMGCDTWPGMKKYADKAMAACCRVISISKDNCLLLEEKFPEAKHKIVMMRNGVSSSVFYPDPQDKEKLLAEYGIRYRGEKIAFFAGKLANFKGVDVLLRAASIYEEKEQSILTILAGDGEERDKLYALKDELGLRKVHFIGNVNQDALRKLYSIADASLVPSRREPFGLVAIEAMACGAPVIATNQGGLPDFVNESVGRLVEPEDAAGFANAVTDIVTKNVDMKKWRADIAAYAVNNYSQDAITKELEALYREVTA